MKKIIYLIILSCCVIHSRADYWTQKANFPVPTVFAAGFAIGDSGYAGTGAIPSYVNTFYKYDPAANTWTTKSNFGGLARAGASSFVINNKGYVVNGISQSFVFKDCWEYDPAADTWTQKADFGGLERASAASFVVNGKAYVGIGDDGIIPLSDFWEYNPVTNTWQQKANFSTLGRTRAASFSIGNKGYVGCGQDGNLIYRQDFWEYDPAQNSWTQIANFPGGVRMDPAGLATSNYGYVGTGVVSVHQSDWWQYDPSSNSWIQKANYGGAARGATTGFVIGNKVYLGTGGNGTVYFQDWWEYTPDSVTGTHSDGIGYLSFKISPNPVRDFCELSIGDIALTSETSFNLFDIHGKLIASQHVQDRQPVRLDFRQLDPGVYFLEVRSGTSKGIKKIVKD